jgi:DNA-binding MarR family transcriptional regulator
MTASAVFTPLPDSEVDAALSGTAAELHDIAQVQSKNLRLLQAVMRANLKGGLKNLLWLLCMHYNDSKDCAWPSIERLAKLSLTEARTVQRNLKQLVKAGLVQVGRVPGIRSSALGMSP